jgi:hypothetical protein
MAKTASVPFSLSQALLTAFDTNDRINQYLIENLPPEAWRAEPPDGKGRTIAAIAAHMHNVRVMWLKAAAKGSKIPEQLDRTRVTPAQAVKALEQSRAALAAVLKAALDTDGRVKGFRPRRGGVFRLPDRPRRPPSRSDFHAGPPGRTSPAAEGHVRHVGVGLAVQIVASASYRGRAGTAASAVQPSAAR